MDKLNPFSNSAGDSTQNPASLSPNPSINIPSAGPTNENMTGNVNNITSIPPEGISSASLGRNEAPNDQEQATADQQAATAVFQTEHPNRTTSSVGCGAIKLVNDEPRSNKKWLFITLGAVTVLAVVGVIVAMIMNSVTNVSRSEILPKQIFANYEQLLIYGPDNQEKSSDDGTEQLSFGEDEEWYFLSIDEINMDDSQKREYLENLQSKYNEYTRAVQTNPLNDAGLSSSLMGDLDAYTDLFNIIINYYNLPYYEDEIILASLDNPANVSEIISERILSNSPSPTVSELSAAMVEYLELEAEAAEVYHRYGCVKGSSIDSACISNIGWDNSMTSFASDMKLEKIKSRQTEIQVNIDNIFLIICGNFRALTEDIQGAMELSNE